VGEIVVNDHKINGVIKPKTFRKEKKSIPKKKKVKSKRNIKDVKEKRDKRCLACGSTRDLGAHHIKEKSIGGDDSLCNLITLCFHCHRKAHDGYYVDGEYVTTKEFMIDILEYYPEIFSEITKELKNEI